jgi:hypothetical protein
MVFFSSCRQMVGPQPLPSTSFAIHYAVIVVLLYPLVICSKLYRGYVKPRIILNAIYNMIFVEHTQIW